ncbi:hypothetical protein WILDE_92 [Arthrobacter phage Wilde]|uniref:Uncharacterized protein n=1 Tax=Arthrobacter phage Wilde TaxID=1772323 RepID=A0A0U4IQ91_9CAUD|nr:hypothetical protein WILDE_92 [Arthrobacter phage Wilde]
MTTRAVHFRSTTASTNLMKPSECGERGFTTTDVQAVTCLGCHTTGAYQSARTQFDAVVEALAYPKEEHPCLSTSSPAQPRSTQSAGTGATSPPTRRE